MVLNHTDYYYNQFCVRRMAGCALLALLFLLNNSLVNSSRSGNSRLPLLDDNNIRSRNRAAECVFGRQIRELGSTWVPDLGTPFGALHCMRCECVPVQKKRRTVAHVHCRNIKHECPRPTCENPIQKPGLCCKFCPGDDYDPLLVQDIIPQSTVEEDDKSVKHFAALLTGRSSLVLKNEYMQPAIDQTKKDIIATGRFIFHRRNLHYSFQVNEAAGRPRSVQFMDREGIILQEFTVPNEGSLYQNATGKVCGFWRRLPHSYCKLLKQEKLLVALVWPSQQQMDVMLNGKLLKYVALNTEMFSALLEPSVGNLAMEDTGGTAMVSISTAVTPSIHIAAVFNGLFSADERNNVLVVMSLQSLRNRFILEERILVEKLYHHLNLIEVTLPLSADDLRLLVRGKLVLSIYSQSQPETLRLSGVITTKLTCELFQTSLASFPGDSDANLYGSTGLAWSYLNANGSLVFNIRVDDLPPEDGVSMITLYDAKRGRTELEDLTPFFDSGWANGTLDKLSPKVLEPLYAGNLGVKVATRSNTTLIRGKLTAVLVAEARDGTSGPILLKRENHTLSPAVTGLAWMTVDSNCHLNYDVTLSGVSSGSSHRYELHIDLLPMLVPGAPVLRRYLSDLQGLHIEGSPVHSLSKEELNCLANGVGFFKVKSKDANVNDGDLLIGMFQYVYIPETCRPATATSLFPSVDHPSSIMLDQNSGAEDEQSGNCFFAGQFHPDESQWTTVDDPCTMCFCQNGVHTCDTMVCPTVDCAKGELIRVDGECCPICVVALNSSSSSELLMPDTQVKCNFSGQLHSPSSRFHPFMIPLGFDKCTECVCNATTLEIQCVRRRDSVQCCANCRPSHEDYSLNGTLHSDDETAGVLYASRRQPQMPPAMERSEQILAEGGCRNPADPLRPYTNGTEFNPYIQSLGRSKCIICKCLDGKQTCGRISCDKTTCDKSTCEKIWHMRRKGHTKSTTAECCCRIKTCRKYRHKKLRRLQYHHNYSTTAY